MPSKTNAVSRRGFLRKSSSLASSLLLANAPGFAAEPQKTSLPAPAKSRADVGSLFPVIERQAVQSDFPLSFLSSRFKSVKRWKQTARAKVLDLLHYSPASCNPAAEVVEKVDQGDFVREKIYFNTTASIRVPAWLLVPKTARQPAPAIVALHDHGGFYLWGKKKLLESKTAPPAMKSWRKTYYGNQSIAAGLARQGYVVLGIDMS